MFKGGAASRGALKGGPRGVYKEYGLRAVREGVPEVFDKEGGLVARLMPC